MKFYIIAGEASGDLHASNLIKKLKRKYPEAEFRAWGGDEMIAAGCDVVKHYRDLAFMGFKEVLMNLRTIMKNLRFCKKDILSFDPDLVIFVDYPGFNLRVAGFASHKGYKTVYYISPQVWAWKESRLKKIKRFIDKMIVILPFEEEFYRKHEYPVDYVGHPLLDIIPNYGAQADFLPEAKNKEVVALLPGSRKQEIATMLPIMLETVQSFPEILFVVAAAPGIEDQFYEQYLNKVNTKIVRGKTYDLFKRASAALVTSGTATLEAGLFRIPTIVCYKGSSISYQIARRLIKVKYISLVNLILDRPFFTELIQKELNPENLKIQLKDILVNLEKYEPGFDELYKKLGGEGASERAAQSIQTFLNNET